jgi:membrane protein implicated in regulation of membrane protease activity
MKNTSARAITWFAAILLFLGLLLMSPSGSFFVYVLATFVALPPAIFGTKKIRIFAIILLLTAIFLAVNKYPEFKSESDKYSRRGKISQINPGHFHRNLTSYSGGYNYVY